MIGNIQTPGIERGIRLKIKPFLSNQICTKTNNPTMIGRPLSTYHILHTRWQLEINAIGIGIRVGIGIGIDISIGIGRYRYKYWHR